MLDSILLKGLLKSIASYYIAKGRPSNIKKIPIGGAKKQNIVPITINMIATTKSNISVLLI